MPHGETFVPSLNKVKPGKANRRVVVKVVRTRRGAGGTAMPTYRPVAGAPQFEAHQQHVARQARKAAFLGLSTPDIGDSILHAIPGLAKAGVRAGINLDKTIYNAKFGAPDKRLGASLDLANDATGYRQVEQIRQHPISGSIALAGLLPGGRLLRGGAEFAKAVQAAEEGTRLAEGTRAGVESFKAGKGVVGPTLRAGGRGAKKVGSRVFKVGDLEAKQAHADSRIGSAIERTIDKHREALAKVGLMNSTEEKAGRRAATTIKARADVGTSPGDALLTVVRRPSWRRSGRSKDYALRILAEHSLPGNTLSIADRRAFHLGRAEEMGAAGDKVGASYHRVHGRLIKSASKFLHEDADGSITIAADAPNDLREAWRLLQKTAAGREDIYRDIGRLNDTQIARRIQAPGRVFQGARWMPDEKVVQKVLDANPKRAELFRLIDETASDPKEAQAAKDAIDASARSYADASAAEGDHDPVTAVDELFTHLGGTTNEVPREGLFQIDPFHDFADEKKAANLRAKLNPRTQKNGLPVNKPVEGNDGIHFAGPITPEAWVKRVSSVMESPEEIDHAAHWYEHFEQLFRKEFPPEIADKIIRAFAVSQANASPSSGVASSLAALERLDKGEEVGSIGSVVADNIEKALRGEKIDSKVAAKLSDFIDALRGSDTRTWMGHASEGGAPAPIDIWGLRDQGYIDKKIAGKGRGERLLKMHGVDVNKLKVDVAGGGASGSRYERAAEKYHEITDHLNAIGFNGRSDWTPAQTQALGWAAIQKHYGQVPEDLVTAITKGRVRAKGILHRGELQKIVEEAKQPDGGATLYADLTRDTSPEGAVGAFAHFEKTIPSSEFTAKDLTKYVREHKDMLRNPNYRVGIWHRPEDGLVYLDISRALPSREEALAFGRENGQDSIFDREAAARGDWDNAFPKTGLTEEEQRDIKLAARAKAGAPKLYKDIVEEWARKNSINKRLSPHDMQAAEDSLHEWASANPDHPLSQQFTRLYRDAHEMNQMATPEPEDLFQREGEIRYGPKPSEERLNKFRQGSDSLLRNMLKSASREDAVAIRQVLEERGHTLEQRAHTGVWGEPEHQSWGGIKGAYTPEGVIHLVQDKADVSTVAHEWAHHLRANVLTGHAEDVAAKWSGATLDKESGEWVWDRQAEEKFARGVEQYLRTGQGLPGEAGKQLSMAMREIYDHAELPDVTPQMAKIFDRLFSFEQKKGGRLLGAEDFHSGVNYVPYTRGAPVALSREAATYGAYIRHRLQLFNPGTKSAIGAGPDDVTLRNTFTGALLRSGNFKADVTRASTRSLHTAWRLQSAKMARDVLLQGAEDLPRDSTWLAIKVDPTQNLGDEVKRYWDRIHSVEGNGTKLSADDLGELDHADDNSVDEFIRDLFPGEVEGQRTEDLAQQLSARAGEEMTELKKPIENIKWIPKELLDATGLTQIPAASKLALRGLTKQQRLSAQAAGLAFDAFNDIQRAGLLILSPSYIPVNLLGNVAMNVLHQGPLAFPNLIRSVLLHREFELEDRVAIDKLMGRGIMESVLNMRTGPGELINHTIGHWSGVLVDLAPRRAAFLHEARKAGYKTSEEIRSLLHDEANTDDLVKVRDKATEAIVDYDRLSPFERNIVSRAIFVYPWIKGATHYSIRFAANHPVETMALALMADNAVDNANSELGPRPFYAQMEIPVSTKSLGLQIPGTNLGVDASELVGNHELKGKTGMPYTVNPRQLLTQTTPYELAAEIAGTAGAPGLESLAGSFNPGLTTLAEFITGHDPNTHQDIPQNIGGLLGATRENFAAVNKIKAINSADPSNQRKLYPRSRNEAIESTFLSGLAPHPYNTAKGQALTTVDEPGASPEEQAHQWVKTTEKAIGEKLPPAVIAIRNSKATYESMEKAAAKKTATGKLTEIRRGDLLLEVLLKTHPELQQYAGELWRGIRQDPTASQSWIEDKLGWSILEKLDTAVNEEKKDKKLAHAHG